MAPAGRGRADWSTGRCGSTTAACHPAVLLAWLDAPDRKVAGRDPRCAGATPRAPRPLGVRLPARRSHRLRREQRLGCAHDRCELLPRPAVPARARGESSGEPRSAIRGGVPRAHARRRRRRPAGPRLGIAVRRSEEESAARTHPRAAPRLRQPALVGATRGRVRARRGPRRDLVRRRGGHLPAGRAEKLAGQSDLVLVKDLDGEDGPGARTLARFSYRPLETEPNMVLEVADRWR